MMSFSFILREIREEKRKAESLVLSNGIENFESYKLNLGKIQGLDRAIVIIENILRENND